MIYTYDGTFFGYLSVVFDAWHDGLSHVEQISTTETTSLFAETHVPTDTTKAERILTALQEQCGKKAAHFLYYGFLAEQPQRELALLTYLRLAFRYKDSFYDHLSDEHLWKVRLWAQKTGNERHKLLGLLRFQELSDQTLYARINPTCDVVAVMAPHFARRMPKETWVIHDVTRHMGVYHDGATRATNIVLIPKTLGAVDVSAQEEAFETLWKQYYQTIAIEARCNERLRRQYMPKKYWPYIGEVKNGKF